MLNLKLKHVSDQTVLGLTREYLFPTPPEVTAGSYDSLDTAMNASYRRVNFPADREQPSVPSPPVLISKTEPEYSEAARKACLEGEVMLSLVVDEHGVPRDIHTVRGVGLGLDEKAIEAVMQWRFRPGSKDGKPVATQAQVMVNFHFLTGCARADEAKPTSSVAPSSNDRFNSPSSPARYKDRREYDLFSAAAKTADTNVRLEILNRWEAEYPGTKFVRERLQYFVATLGQMTPTKPELRRSLVQRCTELLAVDKSDFSAAYFLSLWGPITGGTNPSPEFLTTLRTAAGIVIGSADSALDPQRKPTANGNDLKLAKTQAITVAQNAIAYAQHPTRGASSKAVAEHDLRVQIVQVQWNNSEWGATGFGKGNLLSTSKQGFDFTFTCSRPFLPSDGNGYYPGSWKKVASRLVILTTEVGNTKKHSSCELKVSMEPYAFEVRSSDIVTVPIAQAR